MTWIPANEGTQVFLFVISGGSPRPSLSRYILTSLVFRSAGTEA